MHMHITERGDIMPRPRKCRMVGFVPVNPCFHPQLGNTDEVLLCIDEIEAIRLADLKSMNQDAAALSMNVSRGTFQRIINTAHRKLADAMVNGKTIRIQGGNYQMAGNKPCCKDSSRICRGRRCNKPDKCEGGE